MNRLKKCGGLLAAIVCCFLVVTEAQASDAPVDTPYLLEVVVNGQPIGKIGEFVLKDGNLFARPGELHDLGFRVPNLLLASPETLLPVSSLPGVSYRLDIPTQTLFVTAENQALLPTLIRVPQPSNRSVAVESGTGLSINYDVVGNYSGSSTELNGSFDVRAFSPYGVLSTGLLAYRAPSQNIGSSTYAGVRLDTTFTYSDPDALHQYRVGDFINDGLSWTRPVRLGGLQFRTDFALRPDLVTMPLPLVSGAVAVPSTVDVLINGDRVFATNVQPGPFEIPQLPVVSGASTISLAVTNALGRQEVTTLSIYSSAGLLAPGLDDVSASLGFVRLNWGVVSNDYGDLAGSATWRRGLSADVTAKFHIEATPHVVTAGGGANLNVANLGFLSLDAAASTSRGGQGALFAITASRLAGRVSFGASATLATPGFRDIAASEGEPVPTLQLNGSVGFSLDSLGTMAIAYTVVERPGSPTPNIAPEPSLQSPHDTIALQPAEKARVLSASYTLQIRDTSLYATAFRDFSNKGSGISIGLTIPLGARGAVSGETGAGSGGEYGQAQANQTAAEVGDWGYQVYGSEGTHPHQFGEVQYKSPYTELFAGVDHAIGSTNARIEARGALSYVDGGVFASNAIDDSFAIVDTGGVANIPVLREHREIGRTDDDGRLFVPDLRSFDINHIEIDPSEIPADVTLPSPTRDVRPQDRSGIVVRFPLHTSHGALLSLVDDAGNQIALGSTVTLKSSGASAPVGYDGETYIEDLEPNNELKVVRPDGRRCKVNFNYKPVRGDIPAIGPLTCHEAMQ